MESIGEILQRLRIENTNNVQIDSSKNDNLRELSKDVLNSRYQLHEEETPQDIFARVANKYGSNNDHAQRIYDYMSDMWFMPATPILANGGSKKGLPISCYLNTVDDSLEGIWDTWIENGCIATNGGGIGTCWSDVRSIGTEITLKGSTTGIIPFIKVSDSISLAVSQGSVRRGSQAAYLDISHPEIEEFLSIRKPQGDISRKCLNLHNGIVIYDAFMEAVDVGDDWELIDPKTKEVKKVVNARELWQTILDIRAQTGEPYLVFIDTVNRDLPEVQKKLGLKVTQSNLCSEITLPTGKDHLGNMRTAICCLSSLNLKNYDLWHDNQQFYEDVLRFLDNVLDDFIATANQNPHLKKAAYSALRERSIGLGVMGFHTFLQEKGIPIESVMSKSWNKIIFKNIKDRTKESSKKLAEELGPCADCREAGIKERFSNILAIAPTASISLISNAVSPGIEPIISNYYTLKNLLGYSIIKNPTLEKYLDRIEKNTQDVWNSILHNNGSVQHLVFMPKDMKDVFKTAYEINQDMLIDLAADRQPHICQAQSLNLFFTSDTPKWRIHRTHFKAWQKGLKSLYYNRSTAFMRSSYEGVSDYVEGKLPMPTDSREAGVIDESDECLVCQ